MRLVDVYRCSWTLTFIVSGNWDNRWIDRGVITCRCKTDITNARQTVNNVFISGQFGVHVPGKGENVSSDSRCRYPRIDSCAVILLINGACVLRLVDKLPGRTLSSLEQLTVNCTHSYELCTVMILMQRCFKFHGVDWNGIY